MFLKSGYSLLGDPAATDGMGARVRKLLAFISTRVFRGRARLIITLVVVLNIVFLGLLPDRLSGVVFGGDIGTLTRWRGSADRGQNGGGLRIVAFGSPDMAMGNDRRSSGSPRSWTEYLCDELHCSSHLSFVPQADPQKPDPALISNSLYQEALDNLLAQKFKDDQPGFDYTWLRDQYPVPAHPDLRSQVATFLGSRRPRDPPKETLWVFNFGAWDVWNLAALPREFAETVVDYMVLHLFEQIELLYRTSLSETSIAFSDFWGYSSPETIKKLQANKLTDARAEMETFRVLIPETLDISVTPGWHSSRPRPPPPHSLAVHMTNALYLADRWNAAVKAHTTEWEKLPHPTVDEVDTSHRAEARSGKRSVERVEEPLYAPYPRRKALVFNAPEFVLEAMIEKQMHDTSLVDSTGRGKRPDSDPLSFSEVARPCIGEGGRACKAPDEFLFQTPFSLSARGMREVAVRGAAKAREDLYLKDEPESEPPRGVGSTEKSDSSRRDAS